MCYDDDHGPMDSDYGDSESDHVWADLARSESLDFDPATTCAQCESPLKNNEYGLCARCEILSFGD